jgi:hypothetical protein
MPWLSIPPPCSTSYCAHSILSIADEVITVLGHTGWLFTSDYFAAPADIVCFSKGLTSSTLVLITCMAVVGLVKSLVQIYINVRAVIASGLASGTWHPYCFIFWVPLLGLPTRANN